MNRGSSTSSHTPVVGHFLIATDGIRRVQENPSSGVDRSAILELMAREQPPVLSMKRLRKVR